MTTSYRLEAQKKLKAEKKLLREAEAVAQKEQRELEEKKRVANEERIAKKLEQDVMLGGDTTNVLPREMQDGKIQIKTAAREGNKFTKALMAARENGNKFFTVNGKEYETEALDDKDVAIIKKVAAG